MDEKRLRNWRNMSDENREKAIQIAKKIITPERAEWIHERHRTQGLSGTDLDHFGWGMGFRNAMREHGLTDDKIHGNWDDYYVDIALLAVGIEVLKDQDYRPSVYGGWTEAERKELNDRYQLNFIRHMRELGLMDLNESDAGVITNAEMKEACIENIKKMNWPEFFIYIVEGGKFITYFETLKEYLERGGVEIEYHDSRRSRS